MGSVVDTLDDVALEGRVLRIKFKSRQRIEDLDVNMVYTIQKR